MEGNRLANAAAFFGLAALALMDSWWPWLLLVAISYFVVKGVAQGRLERYSIPIGLLSLFFLAEQNLIKINLGPYLLPVSLALLGVWQLMLHARRPKTSKA